MLGKLAAEILPVAFATLEPATPVVITCTLVPARLQSVATTDIAVRVVTLAALVVVQPLVLNLPLPLLDALPVSKLCKWNLAQ